MTKNHLAGFPSYDRLIKIMNGTRVPAFREANAHIHTPYSFSAFDNLETALVMAEKEEISVLGINDFFVTDGYKSFHTACIRHNVFPLFNIEFICLLQNEQKNGIRINDPNNPGRVYISGKGLDYPIKLKIDDRLLLRNIRKNSQLQIKRMISRLNILIKQINPSYILDYEDIKEKFAEELVRERHLAKAIRHLAEDKFSISEDQKKFIESLYGGKESKASASTPAALENEIRSNLLKAGGAAYVEEDRKSFPDLKRIIKLIINAGGIPCYPVLLDDKSGNRTDYERDPEKLFNSLNSLGIGCIEMIPGRNSLQLLRDYVDFFNKKDFIIIFGTEHNTPEMLPLTITARDSEPLDETLKRIAWEGVCVIAAHQYLRAQRRQGYILNDGSHSKNQKNELFRLGQIVIEYYLGKNKEQKLQPDETGNQ